MAPDPELARMPDRIAAGERVVLRPSRRRKLGSLVLALWAALFVAAGIAGLRDTALALILLVPSLPLFLYWLAVALPRSGALTIDKAGFEARHAWITRRWDWDRLTGFGVRHVLYPRGGGIDLVSFATRDPRERPGDLLQELAIRGLTRTTTLPDRFGQKPEALAEAMSQCRLRFADEATPDDGPAIDEDVMRSRIVNAVTLVGIAVAMTAGGLFLALAGDGGERALGWLGVAFFGVGGAVAIAIRWRQGQKAPRVIDANAEIATTAASSGLPEDVAGRVLEAHYAYLEQHPRDRILDVRVERSWVARESGLDADTVRRVLEAHDDYLIDSGLMSPVKARGPA